MTHPPKPRAEIALPATGHSLPLSLIRAREAVMAPIRKMLLKAGITEQQWRVLRVLSEDGSVDAGSLARRAGLMSPSLTRIIQSMETNGLVTRQPDAQDRRRQHIAITQRGQAIIDAHMSEATDIAAYYRDVLGDADHDRLIELLQRLARSIEEQDPVAQK